MISCDRDPSKIFRIEISYILFVQIQPQFQERTICNSTFILFTHFEKPQFCIHMNDTSFLNCQYATFVVFHIYNYYVVSFSSGNLMAFCPPNKVCFFNTYNWSVFAWNIHLDKALSLFYFSTREY